MADDLSIEEQFARAQAASKPAPTADDPYLGTPGYNPPAPPRPPGEPYKGMLLPFSKDASGDVKFDSKAGILGAIRQPFDFTYDVRTGKIPSDINDPRYIGGVLETALGFGPGSAAARAGRGVIQAPSREALDTAADVGFNAYRDSGQIYQTPAYRSMLRDAADNLLRQGFHDVPDSAQLQHRIIQHELDRTARHPFVTSQDVDALRAQLSGAGLRGPPAAANQQLRNDVFGFIEQNLPPDSGRSVRDAVGNYRQARHSEAVTQPEAARSELNIAKGQGPQLSAEEIRSNIARLVNKIDTGKGAGRGFSDVEENILRSANRATPGIDRAQRLGDMLSPNISGGGGALGLGSAATALSTGHPALAAGLAAAATVPAAAGAAARSYANRGARRIADEADNAIRAQAPFAREQWATSPNNFTALPGQGGGVGGVIQGPAAAAAVSSRMQELQPPPAFPPRYQILPDGTIQETL